MAAIKAKGDLIAAAQSFYNDKQLSDFTITCEDKEVKVHRCFIIPHSRFFQKACSGMFKETQQRKIELKEDDPYMVELMVKFFYTFEYDNTPPPQSEISSLGHHMCVYTIADKYEVLRLKSLALEKFKQGLVAQLQDGKAMVEAVHALTAYRPLPNCDTTLHDVLVESWIHGGEQLFANIGEAEVSSLFTAVPWLSVAVAIRMMKGLKPKALCARSTNTCHIRVCGEFWKTT